GHGGQVLLSEAAAGLAQAQLPDGAGLIDLGEHRLKDLDRAERIFQLTHPALVRDFGPLRTPDQRPNNLPTPASVFVGREVQLEAIANHLATDGTRLITLIGPGGSGKTRLAVRAAMDQLEQLRDRAYFVDLAPVTDTATALASIARVVGVVPSREQSVLDDLKRAL